MPSGTWLRMIAECCGGRFITPREGGDTHTTEEQNLPQQDPLSSNPAIDDSGSPVAVCPAPPWSWECPARLESEP